MNKLLNKVMIVMFAVFNWLLRSRKSVIPSNKILIIMDRPGIGDTICAMDALLNFVNDINDKYQIFIVAEPSVIHFLEATGNRYNAVFIPTNYENRNSFNVFKNNVHTLNSNHWHYISSFTRLGGYLKLLLLGCHTNGIIASELSGMGNSKFEKLLDKLLPNFKKITYPRDTMILKIYRDMEKRLLTVLNIQTSDEYKSAVISTLSDNPIKNKSPYCIVSPTIAAGHTEQFRGWPLDRYLTVVAYVLKHSNLNICLCGVKSDEKNNSYIRDHASDSSRIIDLTGKTSFKEWIEVIRGARFVLGNDSGYIHLAAKLGVQSFALAGYWNYGRFLPYPKDESIKVPPVDIRIPNLKTNSCKTCPIKKKCDETVRRFSTYQCIMDIEPEMVIHTIVPYLT